MSPRCAVAALIVATGGEPVAEVLLLSLGLRAITIPMMVTRISAPAINQNFLRFGETGVSCRRSCPEPGPPAVSLMDTSSPCVTRISPFISYSKDKTEPFGTIRTTFKQYRIQIFLNIGRGYV